MSAVARNLARRRARREHQRNVVERSVSRREAIESSDALVPPLPEKGWNRKLAWKAASEAIRPLVTEPPEAGANRVLLGHSRTLWMAEIRRLPDGNPTLDEGAAAVLAIDESGEYSVIAVVNLEDWRRLAGLAEPSEK